jgi:ACT domain-containing protein
MMKSTGTNATILSLIHEGVDLVWGYTRGAIMPVPDSLNSGKTMEFTFFITATSHNAGSVLQRLGSLMTRNRLTLREISILELNSQGLAHISLALKTNEETVKKLVKQLKKIVNLLDVKISHKIK